jgi:hypothetical protein
MITLHHVTPGPGGPSVLITLFHVIPGPMGECGLYGHTSVEARSSSGEPLPRWFETRQEGEAGARAIVEAIGPRPQPGNQNEAPIPVILVKKMYHSAADVAMGKKAGELEVFRVWSLADGSCSDVDPESAEADEIRREFEAGLSAPINFGLKDIEEAKDLLGELRCPGEAEQQERPARGSDEEFDQINRMIGEELP